MSSSSVTFLDQYSSSVRDFREAFFVSPALFLDFYFWFLASVSGSLLSISWSAATISGLSGDFLLVRLILFPARVLFGFCKFFLAHIRLVFFLSLATFPCLAPNDFHRLVADFPWLGEEFFWICGDFSSVTFPGWSRLFQDRR